MTEQLKDIRMGKINSFTSKVISKIKKSDYRIDKEIPDSYLFSLVLRRCRMLIRGFFLSFKIQNSNRFIFIGTNVKSRCVSKLKVGKFVTIDQGAFIDALSREGVILGNNVSVGRNTSIAFGNTTNLCKGMFVGNNVGMGTHGHYGGGGGIDIGDDTIIGDHVSIHSENHNYSDLSKPIRLQGLNRKGVKIGADCWIGANTVILDGTEIGNHCVVTAGAVVRGKYPNNCILGGIPSKIIKIIE